MEVNISVTLKAEIIQLIGVMDFVLPHFMAGFVKSSPDQSEWT